MADEAPQEQAVLSQTIQDLLIKCGVPENAYQGQTAAERIAEDVFDNDFDSFIDKTYTDLETDWKSYLALANNRGKITLSPRVKKNIKALVQWVKDTIRLDIDPALTDFGMGQVARLNKRYHTHKDWLNKAADKAKTAKPKQFTEKMKWIDWKDSFANFLRTQPGRNGVPLSYVIRDNDEPVEKRNAEFLDDYIDQAPLTGPAFASDASEVHTFIVSFITKNETAKNKIMLYLPNNNRRKDYQALRDHYKGVSSTAKAIVKAEDNITNMFYAGKKKPHMWWDKFET